MLASALELKSGSSDTGSAQDKSLKEARNQLEQAKATLEQMHLVMSNNFIFCYIICSGVYKIIQRKII
jgi:hypothetical protein